MSACADCGTEVSWFKRSPMSDKWHPPLEYTGTAYVHVNGTVLQTSTYELHHCDPGKVAAESKKRQEAIVQRQEYHAQREAEYQLAVQVQCPISRCGALVGDPCINLRVWMKEKVKQPTSWPHSERRVLAQRLREERES